MVKNSVKNARHHQKNSPKVKAMRVRDELYDPTTIINDENGEALHEEGKIIKRREEHFKDLLNPSGVQRHEIQSRFAPSHSDHSALQDGKF